MRERVLTPAAAARLYDRLGGRLDRADAFEGRARSAALERLAVAPGERVLDLGSGTGGALGRLRAAAGGTGLVLAVDTAGALLRLARDRTGGLACRATATRLPIAGGDLDAVLCSYLLDLLPRAGAAAALAEIHRVLRPGGRLAVVALTGGVDARSRAVIAGWRALHTVSPALCGGCRPLRTSPLLEAAGFTGLRREVVVQLGVPSEVVTAFRCQPDRPAAPQDQVT